MSATDAVKAALARAEQMKHLNAFITLNADRALTAAQKIDAMVAAGQPLPPLAGLPIVVKDNINTADMPTTGGTEALRHARPKANAPSLQKLIDAGAIVIGKTNLHELAFGITSSNAASLRGTREEPA
jgi:Asp-tRNA(Asn)/Glu-tRNA(Gln) amidotransferase A subunit family amidase